MWRLPQITRIGAPASVASPVMHPHTTYSVEGAGSAGGGGPVGVPGPVDGGGIASPPEPSGGLGTAGPDGAAGVCGTAGAPNRNRSTRTPPPPAPHHPRSPHPRPSKRRPHVEIKAPPVGATRRLSRGHDIRYGSRRTGSFQILTIGGTSASEPRPRMFAVGIH